MEKANTLRIVLIIAVLFYAQNVSAWWNNKIIDTQISNFFTRISNHSIVIGNDGIVHIAYVKDSNVIHTYKNGFFWHTEYIDVEGELVDIALDSNNGMHIMYTEFIDNVYRIYYATNSAGSWLSEFVESIPNVGGFSELILDSNDNPHISYWFSESLRYANKDRTGWQFETIDEPVDFAPPSMGLDSNDNPHVSYRSEYKGLRYAFKDSTGWNIEAVNEEDVKDSPYIVLDSNDNPHISYTLIGSEPTFYVHYFLYYAYRDSTGWHTERVDEHAIGSTHPMVIDSNDNIHISYYYRNYRELWETSPYTYQTYILKYAKRVGKRWNIESIDRADTITRLRLTLIPVLSRINFCGGCIANPSIAVDSKGDPHIVFTTGFFNFSELYVYSSPRFLCPPGTWEITNLKYATRLGFVD